MDFGAPLVIAMGPRLIIHVEGAREISAAMTAFTDRDAQRTYAAAIRDAIEPIAGDVVDHAARRTGDFAGSVKVLGGRAGAALASSDPGAGPIDFSGPGSVVRNVPAKLRDLSLPGSFGDVLTARYGEPSRFFFPAIDRHIDEVADHVGEVVAEGYNRVIQEAGVA